MLTMSLIFGEYEVVNTFDYEPMQSVTNMPSTWYYSVNGEILTLTSTTEPVYSYQATYRHDTIYWLGSIFVRID